MKKLAYFILFLLLNSIVFASEVAKNSLFRSVSSGDSIYLAFKGIYNHRITWTGYGTRTTCNIRLQQSVDNITWTDLIAVQNCTTDGSATTTGYANWVRMQVTAITGTNNTIYATYFGDPISAPLGAVTVDTTGLATSANQATLNGHVDGIEALLNGGLPAALGAGGGLKVDGSGTALPISGTVSTTQSGNWSTRGLDGSGNALTSASRGSERALSVQIVDGSGTQVTSFGGSGGTSSNFGSAFPSAGTATGITDGTNMRPIKGLSLGGNYYAGVAVVDGSGNQVTSFGGSGGTASNYASAFPASGTAAGFTDGTNMQGARVFDLDSSGGTQYGLGINLRSIGSGGSAEIGVAANPLQVSLANTGANATAVKVDGTGGTFPVTGTFWQATQPVSAASLPLPSGASTSAKQPALGTAGSASADVITVQGVASMTPLAGNLTQVGGSTHSVTNPIFTRSVSSTGAIPDDSAVDSAINAGENPVYVGGIYEATPTTVEDGDKGSLHFTATQSLMVTEASASTISTNTSNTATSLAIVDDWDESDRAKVNLIVGQAGIAAGAGAVGVTVPRVTLASDDPAVASLGTLDNAISGSEMQVDVVASLPAGTNIIGNIGPAYGGTLTSGVITTAMTSTTSTQLIAATASNYIYVTSCSFSNDHGSVSTRMTLQDGSGGTALWTGMVPFGGGSNITFPTPLKVPTAGNALYVVNVTTGSSTYANCSGFKTTVSY